MFEVSARFHQLEEYSRRRRVKPRFYADEDFSMEAVEKAVAAKLVEALADRNRGTCAFDVDALAR